MNLTKYKDVVFEGSTFPDDPYRAISVKLSPEIKNEYIPALEKLGHCEPLKRFLIAMTHQEGFRKGSRSYRTNNPGNIGNTDLGQNRVIKTLEEGIKHQIKFLQDIAFGMKKAYPLGKQVYLKPYYSPEIAKNIKTYGIPPWLPGYRFTYTGQFDQFIKIYSTGARVTNSYINAVCSYSGIKPTTKLIELFT